MHLEDSRLLPRVYCHRLDAHRALDDRGTGVGDAVDGLREHGQRRTGHQQGEDQGVLGEDNRPSIFNANHNPVFDEAIDEQSTRDKICMLKRDGTVFEDGPMSLKDVMEWMEEVKNH